MSADPDARQLRSFGHRALLMADRIERMQTALERIETKASSSILYEQSVALAQEIAKIAREALQEQQGE